MEATTPRLAFLKDLDVLPTSEFSRNDIDTCRSGTLNSGLRNIETI